jgi:nitroimidazol reductase NimA-like FMN-containing flavoprotein (pyridoxamine 5'-phosphate oxidase superfamily)
MRKKEKEITDKSEVEAILDRALVLRIALSQEDTPYVVPVCFGYKHGCLYIHSAREGKKLDILRRNNRICFEASVDVELITAEVACNFTMRFKSVIGYGRAYFVDDQASKFAALDIITQHYWRTSGSTYNESIVDKTTVIKIEIESMTGKTSQP